MCQYLMGELDNHFCLVFSTKTGWTPYGPLLKSIVCFISFFLTFRTTLHYYSNTLVQTNVGKRHNNIVIIIVVVIISSC